MTVRHMMIFRAVCKADCNTTKAADALHMTQPAVSLAIRELERYYGVHLFDRIGRRLQITDAGRRFLQYAIHITDLFGDMETVLHDWDRRGMLRVGASITIGSLYMPDYVKAYSVIRPGMDVRITIDQAGRLEKKLLSNELDCALIEDIAHDPNLVSEAYMEDRLDVIFPADQGRERDCVLSIDEFRRQRFLLREPGSGTRDVFDRVMEGAGIQITPVWESMSTTALINAVSKGLGIAVLPHRLVKSALERGAVITVGVQSLSFRRNFYVTYHKNKFLTPAAKAFIDLCKHNEINNDPD